MRIRNKRRQSMFFPYAGTGARGVELKPDQTSPDLPLDKLKSPPLLHDLRRGFTALVLTKDERQIAATMLTTQDASAFGLIKEDVPEPEDGIEISLNPPAVAKAVAAAAAAPTKPEASPAAPTNKPAIIDPVEQALRIQVSRIPQVAARYQAMAEVANEAAGTEAAVIATKLMAEICHEFGYNPNPQPAQVTTTVNDALVLPATVELVMTQQPQAPVVVDVDVAEPVVAAETYTSGKWVRRKAILAELDSRRLPHDPDAPITTLRQLLTEDDAGKKA